MKIKYLSVWGVVALMISCTAAQPRLVLQSGPDRPWILAVSNGGRWIAANSGGDIQVFDNQSGVLWDNWPNTAGERPLIFSPDGKALLLLREIQELGQRSCVLRAMPSGVRLCGIPLNLPLSFDGKTVCGIQGTSLVVFDATTGRELRRMKLPQSPVYDRWNPDSACDHYFMSSNGRYVINGGHWAGPVKARIWDAGTGKLLRTMQGPFNAVGQAAVSADGKWFVTEGQNPSWVRERNVKLWNLHTGKLVRTWPGFYEPGATWFRFSSDSLKVLAAGDDRLDIWDIATGKLLRQVGNYVDTHELVHGPYALSPDGNWIAASGYGRSPSRYESGLRLVDSSTGKIVRRFPGPLGGASQVQWSPDGNYLAGGNNLLLWDAHTGELLINNPNARMQTFTWRDPRTLQSSTGLAQVWRMPEGTLLEQIVPPHTVQKHMPDEFWCVNLAPDGLTYLTAPDEMNNKSLFVWDALKHQMIRKIEGFFTDFGSVLELETVIWLPDGHRIVRGIQTGMELWDVETGTRERTWHDPVDPSSNHALAPRAVSRDGHLLAVVAGRNRALLVYDLRSGQVKHTILTHDPSKTKFSYDGSTLWVLGQDGLEEWQIPGDGNPTTSQKPSRVIRGTVGESFDFSPDGKLVALSSNDGVQIWNVERGAKVATFYLLGRWSEPLTRDWIAITPEGYYDSSSGGEARLRWRDRDQFWPVEQSRAQFHRTDLVQKALRAE